MNYQHVNKLSFEMLDAVCAHQNSEEWEIRVRIYNRIGYPIILLDEGIVL